MTQLLLQGYYGKGNFGDDVLMLVTYRMLKQAIPGATIYIVGSENGYIQKLLPEVKMVKSNQNMRYDYIVHGGGGVFFDFTEYGLLHRLIARALQWFGYENYVALEHALRRLLNRPLATARTRIGMGIGIGSFSPGSPRVRHYLPVITDFAALWVRDEASIAHVQPFRSAMHADIIRGSDLAFLTEYWRPESSKAAAPKPRLGIVLRDWQGTDYQSVKQTMQKLAEHYAITGFIFDAESDSEMRTVLADYPLHIWQPETMTIESFAALLAAQDVLLTSRAHGAICGACLGVPSAIVAIEPKLAQVHAMLPNASILVSPDHIDEWVEAIIKAKAIPTKSIDADIAKNVAASRAAFEHIKGWLT